MASVKCPKCGSVRVWKKGYVPSKTGLKARMVCYECGGTFYASAAKPKRTRTVKSPPKKRPVSIKPSRMTSKEPKKKPKRK